MRTTLFAIALVLAAAPARADDAAPRRLTFRAAIDLALEQNWKLAVEREKIAGAEAQIGSTKAKRYPTLHADFIGNYYAEQFGLNFGGAFFRLYKQDTSITTLTISQPLTGLAYLSELVGAQEHDAQAKRDDYDAARLETAYKTAEAYLRVLEARAAADVAHRSVADIDSELQRAIKLREAESYTDIDVLRFRSAKAAADQAALRADTAQQQALASLVVEVGLRDGTAIEIVDDLPAEPPALAVALEVAQARALSARPELAASRERLAAAESSRKAAKAPYFPDIRAIGEWTHTTGVQPFQPQDAELLGLRVSWTVWDWGATHAKVLEVEHDKAIVAIAGAALAEDVRLEVRRKWLDAKTAFDSLAVAQTQQKTAEEAYRLQQVRFDAGAATTTDVLDADTDVARARLAAAQARFAYYLATVALARAVGDLPANHT